MTTHIAARSGAPLLLGAQYPDRRYDRRCGMSLDGDSYIFNLAIAASNYGESW
jgi:hypothetical protein